MAKVTRQFPVLGEEHVLTAAGLVIFENGVADIDDEMAPLLEGISDIRVSYSVAKQGESTPDASAILQAAAQAETLRLAEEAETARLATEAETQRLADEAEALKVVEGAEVKADEPAVEEVKADEPAVEEVKADEPAVASTTTVAKPKPLPPVLKK